MAAGTNSRRRRKPSNLSRERSGKPLSLREQATALTSFGFQCVISKGALTCTGALRPSEVSNRYDFEIRLRSGDRPRIKITDPPLEPRVPGEAIPHTYGPNDPCIYYPKGPGRDWTPSMAIASSIVPWLGLWLMHYEGWLVTGHWEGGGIEH